MAKTALFVLFIGQKSSCLSDRFFTSVSVFLFKYGFRVLDVFDHFEELPLFITRIERHVILLNMSVEQTVELEITGTNRTHELLTVVCQGAVTQRPGALDDIAYNCPTLSELE